MSDDGGSSRDQQGESYTRDPKDIVTETAFRVESSLLGRPLGSPWRRLAAMLIDLTAIGALVIFKEISAGLFAMAAAWIMWRVARPEVDVHIRQRWIRGLLRITAVITFIAGLGNFTLRVLPGTEEDETASEEVQQAFEDAAVSSLSEGLRGRGFADAAEITASVINLRRVESAAQARELGSRAALAMLRTGASQGQVEDAIEEIVAGAAEGTAWQDSVEAVVDVAMTRVDSARAAVRARSDSLMSELMAAASAGDTARATELRDEVLDAAARRRVEPLQDRIDRLEEDLAEARSSPSVVAFLRQLLDDLGFGFSWLALYFTAFVKLWQGHTPGKRLMGLRVVKVRGGKIGWWDAFTRFGGYAASVFTGLVGFAQVFWDPNRQGLHDRIAGTVVIRE